MKDLSLFEKKLGVNFKNKNLLRCALTHRSYLNEHPEFLEEHNERMEFLGDAVLELLVSEYLYGHLEKPEGEMTNLRAMLVNSEALLKIARILALEDYLFLSKGEMKEIKKARVSLLADAVEAIIGAIYLDQGIEKAREFIKKNVLRFLPEILKQDVIKDFKSQFQEIAQEKFNITPIYKVLKEWGPDHERQFYVGAFLEEKLTASGKGLSKKEAEEEAAKKALNTI